MVNFGKICFERICENMNFKTLVCSKSVSLYRSSKLALSVSKLFSTYYCDLLLVCRTTSEIWLRLWH